MKNLFQKFVGIALMGLVLGACSQTATFEDADLVNELAKAEQAGLKLSPYGNIANQNTRVYDDSACATECIDPDDPESWFYYSDRSNFNPVFYIDHTTYQNATDIFYTFTIGATSQASPTIATFNGAPLASGTTTHTVSFPLAEGWQACDLVSRTFNLTRGGQGGGATGIQIIIDYKLIPVCVDEEEPEEECPEAFRYERDETDPNIITFYYTPKGSKIDAQIQMTTPQIAGFEALDGKTYTTFGNPSNGGLRWNGDLVCGQEISFKIKFTPIDCISAGNTDVNLVSTFNVKDLGGNKLTGKPITGSCAAGS